MPDTPIRVLAMPVADNPSRNHLLAALPATEFERLAPHLERVPMLLGETLYEPGAQLQHASVRWRTLVFAPRGTRRGTARLVK